MPDTPFGAAHAALYDQQADRIAPLKDALHLLTATVMGDLPAWARVLCVGAGTGQEVIALATRFPGWRFTAVDPSAAMLDVCRDKLARAGLADRVALHCGTTETLDPGARFDAATAILVSQFIHDTAARTAFFAEIARRLVPGGLLVSADLSAAAADDGQRDSWLALMGATDLAAARARFGAGVAALPPDRTAALIQAAGFTPPVPFFQALLLRAWHATRRQAPEKESP